MINGPLEKVGLGIVYGKWLHASDWMSVYRPFGFYGNPMKLYDEFHEKVAHKIKRLSGRTLLIDCHSFSFLPTVLNPGFSDIDICIGYNDDETRPNKVTIGIIAQHFRSLGYNVGINQPFSNSKTFAVPCEYHSVMIEVNKRLYMDEISLEKTEGFAKIAHDIQSLYDLLLKKNLIGLDLGQTSD